MINHIRDFPTVQLLLIVAVAFFTAEVIYAIASGEIWSHFSGLQRLIHSSAGPVPKAWPILSLSASACSVRAT